MVVLILFVSLALSQTPTYDAKQQIWGLVHNVVCVFTSQLCWYSLYLSMARLSLPEWLVTYQDGLTTCRHFPIPVITRSSVEQLR